MKKEKLNVNNQQDLRRNEHYNNFYIAKQKLKEKYPKGLCDCISTQGKGQIKKQLDEYLGLGYREVHQQYLRELADMIFAPNSDYQKFTWDIMAQVDKELMERRTRPSMQGKYERT